jgi:hypothetical protein
MRSRKELIGKKSSELTEEEIDGLSDIGLNICDKCGEVDISVCLNWIDGEDFYDNEVAQQLLKKGLIAVCDFCLEFPDK